MIQAIFAYTMYFIFWILPIDFASFLGGKIGELLGKLLTVTNIAIKNLQICGLKFNKSGEQLIIKKMWNNLGRIIGELPHWHNLSDNEFKKRIVIEDFKDLLIERSIHKRAIIVSGHIGNWELYNRLMKFMGIKVRFIYQNLNNCYVDNLVNYTRQKTGTILIKKGSNSMRKIIAELKKESDYVLGMLVDHRYSEGIAVPFFNINVMTTQTPAILSERYNIPISMCRIIRTNGARYRVLILPPFLSQNIVEYIRRYKDKISDNSKLAIDFLEQLAENTGYSSTYKTTVFINYLLSQWISENPDQWFLLHKRFPRDFYKDVCKI